MKHSERENNSKRSFSRKAIPDRARATNASACAMLFSHSYGCDLGLLFLVMVNTPKSPNQRSRQLSQCNRETECTELQRNRVSEDQSFRSFREIDDTEVTDGSAFASRVATLQEAAEISLRSGIRHDCLFVFARALKAFEITTGCKVEDLEGALAVWWTQAKPLLPADASFGEYLWTLTDAYSIAKTPLGANALVQALQYAPSLSYKPTAEQREARLKHVCRFLQEVAGDSASFISVRDVAKVIQTDNLRLAQSLLRYLIHKRFLVIETPGTTKSRKATRYKLKAEGVTEEAE